MGKNRTTGMWHKRMSGRIDPRIRDFSSSSAEDVRLVPYDLAASRAHVSMLEKQRIINRREATLLRRGLDRIKSDFRRGRFELTRDMEDVHMNVEQRLKELIGPAADKLHTARSRNDLVAADLRMQARDSLRCVMAGVVALQRRVLKTGDAWAGVVIPGYTHLQQAQPVTWRFYMLSYFYRFQRDFERMHDALKRVNVSPLGSGALAGGPYPIDPGRTSSLLGFDRPAENALDAVSDRDFMVEALACFALVMVHVSSLAEEMVVFSSREFGLVELDDRIATGSSVMPQKKNPDACELLRARAARSIGDLTGLLSILKGLPAAYNRDLQEMKGVFFRQADETAGSVDIASLVLANIRPITSDWAEKPQFCCATDIADHLVIKKGMAFRAAYNVVASSVRRSRGEIDLFIDSCARETGMSVSCITELLRPRSSAARKISKGGTGARPVRAAMRKSRRLLNGNDRILRRLFRRHVRGLND